MTTGNLAEEVVVEQVEHSGLLEWVELQPPEADPIDPGSPGRRYVFKRGEEVEADHEAVAACPGMFEPVAD